VVFSVAWVIFIRFLKSVGQSASQLILSQFYNQLDVTHIYLQKLYITPLSLASYGMGDARHFKIGTDIDHGCTG